MSKKIEQLTPEQEKLMHKTAQEWINNFFACKTEDQTIVEGTKWLYNYCQLKEPDVVIMDSPMGCQMTANLLKQMTTAGDWWSADTLAKSIGTVADAKKIAKKLFANKIFTEDVLTMMRDTQPDANAPDMSAAIKLTVVRGVPESVMRSALSVMSRKIYTVLPATLTDTDRKTITTVILQQLLNNVGAELEYFESSNYGNPSDYGWVAFYDFMSKIGVEIDATVLANFKEFSKYIKANPFYSIQLEAVCIISRMPSIIKKDVRNRLHAEDSPAISFRDGYKLFYWKGTEVKEHWIMQPETITDAELKDGNAERRRILIDILGVTNYFGRIGTKLKTIDEDTDNQGFPMKLMKFTFEGEQVQVLECTCPSTGRIYNLYPPDQNCRNVWDAKASLCNITVDETKAMTIET